MPKRHNYFYFYTQVMFKLHQPYVLVLFLTFFLLLAVSWGKVGCWPDSKLFSPFFEVTNHQQRCVPKCLLGMFYLRSRPCHPIFVKLSSFIDRPTSWAGQAWPFLGLWPCLEMKWAWEVEIVLYWNQHLKHKYMWYLFSSPVLIWSMILLRIFFHTEVLE